MRANAGIKYRLVQILGGYAPGDATSNEALILDRFISGHPLSTDGRFESVIFSQHLPRHSIPANLYSLDSYQPDKNDIVLVHFGIEIEGIEQVLHTVKRRVMVFHNITPAKYFDPYNLHIARKVANGTNQLHRIIPCFEILIAHSHFSAAELQRAGAGSVHILPVMFELPGKTPSRGDGELPDVIKRLFENKERYVLYVGRIMPSKGIVDLIKSFYFLSRLQPAMHLVLVGQFPPGFLAFRQELDRWLKYLHLLDRVHFVGFVETTILDQLYKQAAVFQTMSHHEGFCVPILEAMSHEVPVVARSENTSAIEETMDESGILLYGNDHRIHAEIIQMILEDHALSAAVIAGQNRRIARYRISEIQQQYLNLILSLVERDIRDTERSTIGIYN